MSEVETTDIKTRANLAYIWSGSAVVMLGFIIYKWGDQKEILTLIIGLIGGTILGGIFGVYFGGVTTAKKAEPTVSTNADTTNVTLNATPVDSTDTASK